ncbi:MAG: hypothetical protein ABI823_18370, partial [Bryobacteraceae bacterium]
QDRIAIRRNIQKQQALPASQKQSGFVLRNAAKPGAQSAPEHALTASIDLETPDPTLDGTLSATASHPSSQAA